MKSIRIYLKKLCKTQFFRKFSIVFVMLLMVVLVRAQDAHFSQYYASPIIYNPAQTGVFPDTDLRVATQYRSQWGTMAPNFSMASFTGEKRINNKYGVGAYMLNDDGVKSFNTFNFVISGSYLVTSFFEKEMILSVGLQTGMIYKYIKKNALSFDSQYINGAFNSDLPSGEVIDRYNRLMPEVNLGVNFERTKKEVMFNPYTSFAIMHCTYPKESFLENGKSRLSPRFILIGGTRVNYNDNLFFDPKILIMKQSNNYELNIGISSIYNYTPDLAFTGGVSYRLKDAVILMGGCKYKNIMYRVSYDIVTSSLKTYTRGHGGLEFSVVFMDLGRSGSLL